VQESVVLRASSLQRMAETDLSICVMKGIYVSIDGD